MHLLVLYALLLFACLVLRKVDVVLLSVNMVSKGVSMSNYPIRRQVAFSEYDWRLIKTTWKAEGYGSFSAWARVALLARVAKKRLTG